VKLGIIATQTESADTSSAFLWSDDLGFAEPTAELPPISEQAPRASGTFRRGTRRSRRPHAAAPSGTGRPSART
jgi:hypothetical protein